MSSIIPDLYGLEVTRFSVLQINLLFQAVRFFALKKSDETQLKRYHMYMFDSNAKLPSGLLNGNVNQLGDFDQCLGVQQPRGAIRGQYCLAFIEVKLKPGANEALNAVHGFAHSHYAFRSNLEDPGHRVPRFSTVNWALCVPASCPAQDIELALASSVDRYLSSSSLEIRVHVDPDMCQVRHDSIIPPPASLMAIGFFLAVMGVIATATITDYMVPDKRHARGREGSVWTGRDGAPPKPSFTLPLKMLPRTKP
ncbi:hypothetical protein J6590_043690 [Homalodisca vitripennis]|nr:hypothetical protein J6590_043690 [Homalodisca vitripennis]